MALSDGDAQRRRIARLRTSLIVTIVVAVLLGVIATLILVDLENIGPCNGGLGLPGEVYNCPTSPPPFLAEQLGHGQMENGSFVCSVIVYSPSSAIPYSTELTVWAQTPTGTGLSLTSVALHSASGSLLANYSASGTNWTTDSQVGIVEPDILTITSSMSLIGQQVVISDHASGFAAFLPVS